MKPKGKKRGPKFSGRELREVYSLRLRPSDADKIRSRYGSLTQAVEQEIVQRLQS